MSILSNQKGSSHMVALLGVLVIAVVGFGGYRVLEATTPDASSDTAIHESKGPATLKSSSDVKKEANTLGETTIDSSVNPNQLDDDIGLLL